MANTENKKLAVDVIARIDKLERGMAKAAGTVKKRTGDMEKSTAGFAKKFEANMVGAVSKVNGALGKLGIGGLAAGGVAGIIAGFRNIASSVAEVGDQAKIAGVNIKAFQELKYLADQNRISVDALTDGLKELNLRADEFIVTGGGSAAEAFARLGLNADTLRKKLEDPSALFTEIIGKLGQLDRAAQIRIADEVFGGSGGETFVKLIDQGEAGIRDTIRAANDLGIVMDKEMIDKAAEIDRRFNQLSTTVGQNLKGAVLEAAGALQDFLNVFDQYQRRQNLAAAGEAIGGMYGNVPSIPKSNQPAAPKSGRLTSAADIMREKLIEQRLQDAFNAPAGSVISEKGGSSASRAEREREAVKELIVELEEELRLVNASDSAKRASAASRMAGAAATDAERQKVVALTEAIHQEEEARRKVEEQAMLYRDLTRAGLDDLFAGLENGKNLWESMGDVAVNSLKRIADTLLDDVLDSLFQVNSAGGGLFGGLFGGGGGKSFFPAAPGGLFAEGGYTGAGGKYDPAGIVHKGEFVMNAEATRRIGVNNLRMLQGYAEGGMVGAPSMPKLGGRDSGGGVSVTFAPVINAQGADSTGLARVEQQLQRMKADLPGTIVKTVRDAQGRRTL